MAQDSATRQTVTTVVENKLSKMINFVMNMFVLNSVEQTENFSNMNEVTD
jgi:hypothetical protein